MTTKSIGWKANRLENIPNGHCPNGGAHYWEIESPSGYPTSWGTCRYCGERKEFLNWLGLDLATRRNIPPVNVNCKTLRKLSAPRNNIQGGFEDDRF